MENEDAAGAHAGPQPKAKEKEASTGDRMAMHTNDDNKKKEDKDTDSIVVPGKGVILLLPNTTREGRLFWEKISPMITDNMNVDTDGIRTLLTVQNPAAVLRECFADDDYLIEQGTAGGIQWRSFMAQFKTLLQLEVESTAHNDSQTRQPERIVLYTPSSAPPSSSTAMQKHQHGPTEPQRSPFIYLRAGLFRPMLEWKQNLAASSEDWSVNYQWAATALAAQKTGANTWKCGNVRDREELFTAQVAATLQTLVAIEELARMAGKYNKDARPLVTLVITRKELELNLYLATHQKYYWVPLVASHLTDSDATSTALALLFRHAIPWIKGCSGRAKTWEAHSFWFTTGGKCLDKKKPLSSTVQLKGEKVQKVLPRPMPAKFVSVVQQLLPNATIKDKVGGALLVEYDFHDSSSTLTSEGVEMLCKDLRTAHAAGLVHGDIRKENIVFGKNKSFFIDWEFCNVEGAKYPFLYNAEVPERAGLNIQPGETKMVKWHDWFALANVVDNLRPGWRSGLQISELADNNLKPRTKKVIRRLRRSRSGSGGTNVLQQQRSSSSGTNAPSAKAMQKEAKLGGLSNSQQKRGGTLNNQAQSPKTKKRKLAHSGPTSKDHSE
eukprot:TRINITY_DN67886_c1_g4_i3.p1 TRINITY_DN67886_c1_g4~~TRINITY_DN67886_c1_g4_i3.p1  ORF type:complete len:610 (+),score=42.09 TRINITY_DN67886_c1_g4_i3:131-1960(+)